MTLATRSRTLLAIATFNLSLAGVGVADDSPSTPPRPAPSPAPTSGVVKLNVFPSDVQLSAARDRQSLVVQALYADGITRDVTTESTITPANPALLRREGSTFHPVADGETTLDVGFADHLIRVPVKVANATLDTPISFRLDVMPVFMKAGCNTGSCHGAARGKDGFRLSLFGFDPAGDHFRLTRELSGRRVNLFSPTESTLLEKADGSVPHTGGKRFERSSEHFQTLARWIEAGVPDDDLGKLPTVVAVELSPKEAVLDGEGSTQRMTVRARYSDGTDRDVTSLSVFLSNNDGSASVDDSGLVTAGTRGEAFVMARFETFTVGSQFIVLPRGLAFEAPDEPEANYVDTLVAAKLNKLRITPSPVCSDEVFVRRVFLDIVGLPPTAEEFEAFLASKEPDKRARLIDALLERKEFSEIWVGKWAESLQIRSNVNGIANYKGMFLYYNWLVEKLSKNTPMDEMVRELLGANGGTFKNPATNFYQTTTDTLLLTENVAQVFMGMRIQCAQCHNHPFDRWTQNDYYGFAAFFSQIGRKQSDDYRETIVFNSGGGEMAHPVGGAVMKPKFLGGETPDTAGKDRRVLLANWLASPQNPWFATSFANRVWAHFLGVGIVEPIDDFRVSNPASNPELLEELGKRFTASKYDLKQLVRDVCNSRTYQRSTQRNESNELDDRNFSHGLVRRIKAESLLDAISAVTETKDKFQGLPLGARAVQLADGGASTYFLTTFGRATRETVCSCEVKMEPTLSQALHLLNGDTINAKIKQGGVIERLVATRKFPEERLVDLYVRCLSRKPTREELDKLIPLFGEGANVTQALEDVFWALLNSREFLFNH
ncbi:MAG: DUF1549 domain-containing protein [Isosphaeraceae bacterium]